MMACNSCYTSNSCGCAEINFPDFVWNGCCGQNASGTGASGTGYCYRRCGCGCNCGCSTEN